MGFSTLLLLPVVVTARLPSTFRTFTDTVIINNKQTERFEHFTEAVRWVMSRLECSNQEATHIVWDRSFTVGTDRGIWITV